MKVNKKKDEEIVKSGPERLNQEASEGKDFVKVDAPDNRMQTTQQVSNAYPDAKVESVETKDDYSKKKEKAPSSIVKQDVAAKVVNLAAASGALPDAGVTGRSVGFSGNEGSIAGSTASTPIVGKLSRPDDRFGKKIESITKFIDYIPSEQIVTESDGVQPLAEQKDSVQGYNGSIRNENALSQKNQGAVPGTLNFQRSLDEIDLDMLYFSRGQVVKKSGVEYNDTPTFTYFTGPYAGFEAGETPMYNELGNELPITASTTVDKYYGRLVRYTNDRGNYLPTNLHVTVANGKITQFYFDEMDLSCTVNNDYVANKSATHELIHINKCELARQRMDANAGSEILSKQWSCLPRGVAQPSQTVCYLEDVEAEIGNEVFISYKKGTSALAKAINDVAKNGMHPSRNMRQLLLGTILPEHNSVEFSNSLTNGPFDIKWYSRGAASLMIAMNDSTDKYKTLGSVLSYPNSLKAFLQIADNNMNVFRVDKVFAGVVNSKELFSTIDHDYDAVSPVFVTDKAGVIYPYSWNKQFSFKSLDEHDNPVLENPTFTYAYQDYRHSTYYVSVKDPLLNGIYEFLKSKLSMLCTRVFKSNNFTITIPVVHSTCSASAWDFLVCASTKFMQFIRTNSLVDILRLDSAYGYPYADLVPIESANPMNNANYINTDYQKALGVKTMLPSVALNVCWPELFTPVGEDGSAEMTMLPWYFSENEFTVASVNADAVNAIWARNPDAAAISYPTIRSGVRSAYADIIYSMSERDIRLSIDRIVDIGDGGNGYCVYKYDYSGDGIPVVNMHDLNWSVADFLSLPRELGLSIVPPAGVLTPLYFNTNNDDETYSALTDRLMGILNANNVDLSQFYLRETFISNRIYPNYRLKYYFASKTSASKDPTNLKILEPAAMNIARASAYMQDFNCFPSIPSYASLKTDPGFRMSLAECFDPDGHFKDDVSKFIPFTLFSNGEYTNITNDKLAINTIQKGLWSRVQRIPFAISPWDVASVAKKAGSQDAVKIDVFDIMYLFGFQGMRASDYREDIYNKENDIISLGLNYVHDRFVEDSPSYKDALKYTQI